MPEAESTRRLARTRAWSRENSGALLVVSAVVGGFWLATDSLATNEDVERATRDLATKADLASLASRADLAATERTVNALREAVTSRATTVDRLNDAVDGVKGTVQDLRESVERTNEAVLALSTSVDATSDTVTRLSGTVEGLGRTAEGLDGTVPLQVSCVIESHLRTVQRPLRESCEQARRQ